MKAAQVDREMMGLRQRYAALDARLRTGERSGLYPEARMLTDEVICLFDEAPEEKRLVVNSLAERCEALLRAIAN